MECQSIVLGPLQSASVGPLQIMRPRPVESTPRMTERALTINKIGLAMLVEYKERMASSRTTNHFHGCMIFNITGGSR